MDGRRSGTKDRDADARVSRRDFLERATTVGLGIGAVLSGGLWVPRAGAAGLAGHGALGASDPLLQATGTQRAQTLMLSNAAIAAQWSVDAGRLHFVRLREPNGATLEVPDDVFTIVLADGEPIRASEMRVVGTPKVDAIATRGDASRLAERLPGRQVAVRLED